MPNLSTQDRFLSIEIEAYSFYHDQNPNSFTVYLNFVGKNNAYVRN